MLSRLRGRWKMGDSVGRFASGIGLPVRDMASVRLPCSAGFGGSRAISWLFYSLGVGAALLSAGCQPEPRGVSTRASAQASLNPPPKTSAPLSARAEPSVRDQAPNQPSPAVDDAGNPAASAALTEPSAAELKSAWKFIADDAGGALAYWNASGALELRLACPSKRELSVELLLAKPIASNEELSLSLDQEAFMGVVDFSAKAQGVLARIPRDASLLKALEGASKLGAVYGATQAGQFPLGREALAQFRTACG